ncbi:hypothetical protein SELMODRAFT_79925 [Selaginella moellendorffii]|uniref:Pentacotripeptide-repeat region of PRORP domain-containing protein n=1 Tax=Selaginella moellendorffii TaxID=88036 RepID=D8QWK2_SELML|nr:hypothetical protein SELMODRAFT_79925 [Selaginella moellendorffii]
MGLRRSIATIAAKIELQEPDPQLELKRCAELLRQFGSARSLSRGRQLHSLLARHGRRDRERFVGNLLVQMYGSCGSVIEAREVFDAIHQRNVYSWTILVTAYAHNGHLADSKHILAKMPGHSIVVWNVVITAYGARGYVDEARGLFARMPVANVVSWSIVVTAYAQEGNLLEAGILFDAMPERTVVPCTAMIVANAENGNLREAEEIFHRMPQWNGVDPDKSALMGVIDASSGLACTTKAKIIHMIVEELVHPPDAGIDTKLVSMFAKCGCPEAAREIFDRMEDRGRVAWNSMLAAYAQNERGAEALQLFKEMELEGIEVDEVSFVCVLSVCSHAGMLATACCEFSSMVGDFEIAPVVDHFNCVIDLLGRLGRIGDAQEIVLEMPFEPGTVSWRSVLSACGLQGNVQKASLAATELHNLENQDGGPFVLLSNVHARA